MEKEDIIKESMSLKKVRKSGKVGQPRVSYANILREEVPKIFYGRLFEKLQRYLIKYFKEDSANKIMRTLRSGDIKIVNPENFFYSYDNLNDMSLEEFKKDDTAETFFYRKLLDFKRIAESGTTGIVIREFFLVLTHLLNKEANRKAFEDKLDIVMSNFIITLTNIEHSSPFTIKLFGAPSIAKLHDITNLDLTKYIKVASAFLKSFTSLVKNNIISNRLFVPKIELLYPVYRESKFSQLNYLSNLFRVTIESLLPELKNLDLDKDTPELRATLEALASKKRYLNFDIQPALMGLKEISEKQPFRRYPNTNSFGILFEGEKIPTNYLKSNSRFSRMYVNSELLYKSFQSYFSEVAVNCKDHSKEEIEVLMDLAKDLCLLKNYSSMSFSFRKGAMGTDMTSKITLVDVEEITQEFVDFAKAKIKQIESSTNKKFLLEIEYNCAEATKATKEIKASHIRIISDIHADYNADKNYNFYFGDDYVLNCGDTAGNSKASISWNKNHLIKGIVVSGNHLGYSPSYPELNLNTAENLKKYGDKTHIENTKNEQLTQMGEATQGGNVKFLSNSYKEYQGIIIIASTLYTDFALYGEEHVEECMNYAKKYMNDFKVIKVKGHRVYTKTEDGWDVVMKKKTDSFIRLFEPTDHAYFFKHSMDFIKKTVEEQKDKPIVIMTHHAPSIYSISPKYAGNMLNPAFASNLNQFIIDNPQIRLWAHGHTHSSCDYVLGKTRVVCEPFGYGNENGMETSLPSNYGKRIAIADIKSRKPWTEILKEEIKKGIIQVYKG